MHRSIGWILALSVLVAACGAGDRSSTADAVGDAEQPSAAAAAPAQPARDTAPAAPPEAATESVAEPAGPLFTVQVAAFLDADSARMWSSRLARQGMPVWITTAEVGGRDFYRLRIGAHPELAEARKLGQRIGREYHWPVWVAPVAERAAVPADAVALTRKLLEGA